MRLRLSLVLTVCLSFGARDGAARRTLPDYSYFRALSIDLLGRPPTRSELKDFERPDFEIGSWIDSHLHGPQYAERLRRIYTDLLRLQLPPSYRFEPGAIALHRATIQGPDGKPLDVYYRVGQRRADPAIDGQICFTTDETGLVFPEEGPAVGHPHRISKALLDERTVKVKPWWLYADYRAAHPKERIDAVNTYGHSGYKLLFSLFHDADGAATTDVRVCKEEAQISDRGRVYVSGRIERASDPMPRGRVRRPPMDTAFAKANQGREVPCTSSVGFQSSIECGCGVGLERCLPTTPGGFMVPVQAPLGIDQPFVEGPLPASLWAQFWWAEEANHFIDDVFSNDRDVRELLTSHRTVINGPLAQFYRFFAGQNCCGTGVDLGYSQPEPIFDPSMVPDSLEPEDVDHWTLVPDRGPLSAGILTMPVFLIKYGSRRARAHVVYNAFLCKDFVAANVQLTPSNEPDLTKRPGCSTCHRTLEPLAAYFTRIEESSWTYLPPSTFPLSLEKCIPQQGKAMSFACRTFYDPAFTDAHHTTLRGAYAAAKHAESGPGGLASAITSSPEFGQCFVTNVAQSLLGRQLTQDDDAWKAELTKVLIQNGYRARPLVRAILTSSQYRNANDRLPGGS